MDQDQYYMKRALELAKSGLGQTSPNPSVGCVIVKNDTVIAEARTQNGGKPHAEATAIDMLRENSQGAIIYVTLEPCCISSADKVSCAEKIIKSSFKKVVIGTTDPNPEINGRSIQMLKQTGIEIKVNVLKEECEEVIMGFKKEF